MDPNHYHEQMGKDLADIIKCLYDASNKRIRLEIRNKFETIGRDRHPMRDIVINIQMAGENQVSVEMKPPFKEEVIAKGIRRVTEWLAWKFQEPDVVKPESRGDDDD